MPLWRGLRSDLGNNDLIPRACDAPPAIDLNAETIEQPSRRALIIGALPNRGDETASVHLVHLVYSAPGRSQRKSVRLQSPDGSHAVEQGQGGDEGFLLCASYLPVQANHGLTVYNASRNDREEMDFGETHHILTLVIPGQQP